MERRTAKGLLAGLALAALGAAGMASAEDGGWLADKNFTGNIALTSDYVFRGVSQTDSNPAAQGGFDYAAPVGLHAGAWASNVAFGGGIEMDWYAGFANTVGALTYDVGAIYYSYPKSRDATEFNFWEGFAKLGYKFPLAGLEHSVGLGYNYSPDYFGEDGSAHYLNGRVQFGLPLGFGLAAEVGYQSVEGDKTTGDGGGLDDDDGFDYVHYRFGASYALKGFILDLSYHNTTETDFLEGYAGYDGADSRFVFTVSRAL